MIFPSSFITKKSHLFFLHSSVFITGFASLALELILGRLAAPFFGVSNLVWAVIISVVLVYVAAGSILGGRLADRMGNSLSIYGLIPSAAGSFMALVTMPGYHFLRALYAWGHVSVHLHTAVMVLSLLFFSLPVLAASMLLPAVTRIISSGNQRPGSAIGRVYAINTAGSVIGALFAVLILVPLAGIGWSLYGLSVLLSLCGIGFFFFFQEERTRTAVAIFAALSLIISLSSILPYRYLSEKVRVDGVIFETESPYNSIRVIRYPGSLSVAVNDPHFAQSILYDDEAVRIDPWHAILLPPLMTGTTRGKALILGYGCGTNAILYHRHHPGFSVRGIEIDPMMVDTGRKFIFKGTMPDTVDIGDARSLLYHSKNKYDIIICDVYRFPYVPHHVATVEFAALVRSVLKPGGVAAFNSGKYDTDDTLSRSIAASFRKVFSRVLMLDVGRFNTVLFASDSPIGVPAGKGPASMRELVSFASRGLREFVPGSNDRPLYDEKGYSEFITHLMGIRYMLSEGN